MQEITFTPAFYLNCFRSNCVGTRVGAHIAFYQMLSKAVAAHDFSSGSTPGQATLVLPDEACCTVLCGVGRRTNNPDAYVLRSHRGRVDAFLRRSFAATTCSVSVVVYTREAYLADPDIQLDTVECSRIESRGHTHVIVAVLAAAVEDSPVTPLRFAHNVSGGNNDYLTRSAHELRVEAGKVVAYDELWCVVAD